jgi:hypothetical protein
MSIQKYCDYYFTTKKTNKGYTWNILNEKREVLQTSLDNQNAEDQHFETKGDAEQDCREAIQDHYS